MQRGPGGGWPERRRHLAPRERERRAQAGDEELRRQWARHRVYALIGEHVQTQRPDLLDEIRQLAGRHRLDVPYDPTGAP